MLPELVCLALAVYHEARSEPLLGQIAVAEVVLNRADSSRYPDNVCEVVTQGGTVRHRCQFSYYCDGKPETPFNRHAWRRSVAIAKLTHNGVVSAGVHEATHYHATYVAPYWRAHFNLVRTIGSHIFYRPTRRSRSIAVTSADTEASSATVLAANL